MNEKLELMERMAIIQARRSFWAYRQFIDPSVKKGWWQKSAAYHLQQFYDDLIAGKRPKLVIEAPPQHGKSRMIVEFITWLAGLDPDCRTIYTSVSERLGIRANKTCQRIMMLDRYKKCFPDTRISESNVVTTLNYMRNSEVIEYVDKIGYFRNTTIRGSIVGESLDLGIIDDPIKGRESANSSTIRNATWAWLTDDFFTRFSEEAGMLCILTRWHTDDPIGRLKKQLGDKLKVVTYKAIAEHDEQNRCEGEALFPDHKSIEFLHNMRESMEPENWEALYQQNPVIKGGNMVKLATFSRHDEYPHDARIIQSWDTAQKEKELNDPSVCSTWALSGDKYYLIDVFVKKMIYPELRRTTQMLYDKWMPDTVLIEDKSSGTSLIQDLQTSTLLPVVPILPCKDKVTRLSTCTSAIYSGKVSLPNSAPWLFDFELEIAAFPNAPHDDQVDSLSQALNWMRESTKPILVGW